jgi:hypothetical protein
MKVGKIWKIKEYTSKEFQGYSPFGPLYANYANYVLQVDARSTNTGLFLNGAMNRYQELDLIKHTSFQNYSLTNIKVAQGENMIVVSYYADVYVRIYGKLIHTNDPYFSVWKRFGNQWKWVAHVDLGGQLIANSP